MALTNFNTNAADIPAADELVWLPGIGDTSCDYFSLQKGSILSEINCKSTKDTGLYQTTFHFEPRSQFVTFGNDAPSSTPSSEIQEGIFTFTDVLPLAGIYGYS